MSVATNPTVACILVNWNNFADTSACLASLAQQDYSNLRVLVVDNASTDDSLPRLRAAHPWANYIAQPENTGFPKGCNIGARHPLAASADFVWLLNNDTIVPPGTTTALVAVALANPRAGIVGAVLHHMCNPGAIQAWGGGRISLWTAYSTHFRAPATFGPNTYITFASAFIRRACFDQLNGLYEGAFMYFEDSDFCIRAYAAGWQLTVAPSTAILHKEGGSVGPRNPLIERIVTMSGLTFLGRHAPIPVVAYVLFLALRIAKRILQLDWPSLRAVLHGTRDWRQNRVTPFVDTP